VRVLFLSQRVPYPPNRGDKITTWRLVDRLRRAHDVTVIAFAHDEADREAAEELRRMGIDTVDVPLRPRLRKALSLPLLATAKPLTLGVYGSARLQSEVDVRIGRVDAAYAYSSSMGAFLVRHDVPWAMHFAELDSDKWRQYAERSSPPWSWVYRRECRMLHDYERRLSASAVVSIFCTPLEEEIFRQAIPGRASVVLRNGVDLQYFSPRPGDAEPAHLAFTGVMDYYPNVDGCRWFAREVLPLVRRRFPAVRFTIVGARPTGEVRRLARAQGVTVTGFVPDVREWLARASVAVAPLRIARGIQNKVLEALAMGLPTVGTTSATQGVGARTERDYLVRDDAEGFAAAVVALCEDPLRARRLGAAGRRFVEEHYDWERTLLPLDDVLERCRQARRRRGPVGTG